MKILLKTCLATLHRTFHFDKLNVINLIEKCNLATLKMNEFKQVNLTSRKYHIDLGSKKKRYKKAFLKLKIHSKNNF